MNEQYVICCTYDRYACVIVRIITMHSLSHHCVLSIYFQLETPKYLETSTCSTWPPQSDLNVNSIQDIIASSNPDAVTTVPKEAQEEAVSNIADAEKDVQKEDIDELLKDDKMDMSFEVWSQGNCKFVCPLCDKIFIRTRVFFYHMSAGHGMTARGFREKFSEKKYMMKKSCHKCRVCKRVLLHDPDRIEAHFKGFHKTITSLKMYFVKYSVRNFETDEDHDQSEKEQEKAENMEKMLQLSKIERCMSQGDLDRCHICNKSLPPSKIAIHQHMEDSHGINIIQYIQIFFGMFDRACLYICLYCNAFTSCCSGTLSKHIKTVHANTMKNHTQTFGSRQFAVKSYLKCPMCSETVLHNAPQIRRHMTVAHLCYEPHEFRSALRNSLISKVSPTQPSEWREIRSDSDILQKPRKCSVVLEDSSIEQFGTKRVYFWHSKCVYACPVCLDKSSEELRCSARVDILQAHLKQVHKKQLCDFQLEEIRLHTSYAECTMCKQSNLVHDFHGLNNHRSTKHPKVTKMNEFKRFIKHTAVPEN